jgi:PPOX class probable F420-dependent enzyme
MTRDELARERYVSLASFRRDGREVRTPVWIAPDGDHLVVYTNGTSGKVKRIRNDAHVRLAPCDARGRVRGDWSDARARLRGDASGRDRGLAAVRRKYGWQMGLVLCGSKLTGSHRHRAVIEIELEPERAR